MAQKALRIGAGAGYAGDRIPPALALAEKGQLDYLVFECLAERTIALAQLEKIQNPMRGFDATTWYGLVGPGRMNPSFVKRINEDMNKVMAMPDVMEKFEQYGAEDGGGSPERFAEFMRNETQKWARVVKEAKVQVDA